MITREQALDLAMAKIRSRWSVRDDEPVIDVNATKEEDFGWVFFYNSRRYRDTKKVSFALAGNGPVVVDRKSEEVTELGTAGGIDFQISEYRRKRPPNQASQTTAMTPPPSPTSGAPLSGL